MVMSGSMDIVFAQVPLLKSQLEELKRRSGTTTTKDALQAAVTHYLHFLETQVPTSGEEGAREPAKKMKDEAEDADWWWSPEEKAEV